MPRLGRSRPASNYLTRRNVIPLAPKPGAAMTLSLAFSGTGTVFDANGFPNTILPIKVELLLNGTWTDITLYVYSRSPIVITRGRPDENQQIQPSTMTLTLNNTDFRFSPKNTGSPYYPYLTRNTQIRVSVNGVISTAGVIYSGYRFWGEVASWPPQWDQSGRDIYVSIQAGGILRRYVQGRLLGSSLRRFYMLKTDATTPIAYWPCEEGSGSSQFSNLIVAGDDMIWTGAAPTLASDSNFAGSDPLPLVSLSTWTGPTGSFSSSGSQTFSTPGTYTWQAPGGVTSVNAQCWGAGGGGSGGADAYAGGSGGGGGHYGANASVAVTAGNNYTVVVGSGGSGGIAGDTTSQNPTAGGNGGNSSFAGDSVTVTGYGGQGALPNPQFPGAAGLVTNQTVIFTSSGTWTAPTGVSTIKAECWGGGGGPAASGGGKGGGGGGEYAAEGSLAVTAGHVYSFTVGAGGSGGNSGGNTTFPGDSVTVTAHGGSSTSTTSGGAGGTGSGNTTHNNGGAGGTGTGVTSQNGGGGGSGGTGSAGNTGGNGSSGGAGSMCAAVTGGGPGSGVSNNGNAFTQPPAGPGGGGANQGAGVGYPGMIRLTYTVSAPSTSNAGGAGGAGFLDTSNGEDGGGGGGSSGGTASAGNAGSAGTSSGGGAGGAAVTGGGAGGAGAADPNSGTTGSTPGGGGGGSGDDQPATGGNGAAGQVSLTWTPTGTPNNVVLRFLLDIPAKSTPASGTTLIRGVVSSGSLTSIECYYSAANGGSLSIRGFTGTTKQFDSAGAGVIGVNGVQLMVSLELVASGSNINWKIDSITPGSGSSFGNATGTYSTATIGAISQVLVAPNGGVNDTGIGHVVLQYALENLTVVSASINGHIGETAGARFVRLAAEQGFGGIIRGNASDTPQMGPQLNDTLTNLLQEIEDCDRGQLLEARDMLGLYYRTRVSLQNQAAKLILNYVNAVLAGSLNPVYDDQLTRNDIAITRPGGSTATTMLSSGNLSVQSPPNGAGDYNFTATIFVQNDGQLANLASWILRVGTVDQYRYPVIEVDLTRSEVAGTGLFDSTPALDIGDYLQITNPPTQVPENPVKQLAFGFTETLLQYTWDIAINAVPETPYEGGGLPTW